ncbi:MAG: exodeoxyribonuclease V subunit gamma [Sporichthyaceae bacterium]
MLHLHRCSSADVLVGELAALLAAAGEDPFAAEVVAVPAAGVERWLAQRLSHVLGAVQEGAGICANVEFPSPARLLDGALAAVDDAPDAGAWAPNRTVWPLLALIDDGHPVPGGATAAPGRRYAWAARMAGVFARYGQERPEMLAAWARGEQGPELPADLAWQPVLWRALRASIGTPSPAERLPQALARLRADPQAAPLPGRLSVFGLNRLDRARLQVLVALAAHREVHLWIHHASPALWQAIADGRKPAHPFLASMSRDVQALQRRLIDLAPAIVDRLHPAPAPPATLLGRLQAALYADAPPTAAGRVKVEAGDESIAVHACHGRARQVEVLRDVLLHRLAADPTLQPRDVLVMCPDIEAFAPLVAAAFGAAVEPDAGTHPAATLRVRLADRAPRAGNPLFGTVEALLHLAAGRAGFGAVLDFVETDPVRRRFDLDIEQTAQLRDWAAAARVSWGYDTEHRRHYGLGAINAGTWRNGLDRLLLGVAMEDAGEWIADAVPLDDVDSTQIELAGRFAELFDRVRAAVDFCGVPKSAAAWARGLGTILEGLATPSASWQLGALLRDLDELAEQTAGYEVVLDLADFTALWALRTPARPSRAGFRTGSLTVATMVPMRSVPHRVVVLLGLDDGAFPRADYVDGDDLLTRDHRDGERDPRTEDRQLLLDAVCAAREHLVVLHTGADERSGLEVPPAVPLAELLEAVDGIAVGAGNVRASVEVTIRHPLQPFDPRNFGAAVGGAEPPARPFRSFDPAGLAGATALAGTRHPRGRFLVGALAARELGDVDLAELRSMLVNPAKEFLWQRLGVRLSEPVSEPPEALPIELDGLLAWGVGDRLLEARLAEREILACLEWETRRGVVPPGLLGVAAARRIGAAAEAVAAQARPYLVGDPDSVDVTAEVRVDGTDRRLAGTVEKVYGGTVVRVSYSRLGPGHLLRAWVDLLALTVARPAQPWQAVAIGRGSQDAVRRVLGPVPLEQATEALADLIGVADRGRCEPLPLPLKTAYTWASCLGRNMSQAKIRESAERDWTNRWGGESAEPAHVLVWGPEAPLDALDLARLATLSSRVWAPFLAQPRGGGR